MTGVELSIPDPDLRALAQGESIVAFAAVELAEGAEVALTARGPRARGELKPAYARWADEEPPRGAWTARVDRIVPVAAFRQDAGDARHILASPPPDATAIAVLRVYGDSDPVLTDEAYAARRRSLDAALDS